MNKEQLKKEVENEIIKLLEEEIVNNIEAMKGDYTTPEIAKEVLLSFNILGLEPQEKVEKELNCVSNETPKEEVEQSETILKDDELICANCNRVLNINSEDMCNSTCNYCKGEAC